MIGLFYVWFNFEYKVSVENLLNVVILFVFEGRKFFIFDS